ncbi:SDR family NAD(P)-dependent oxidoreductase [Sphingorhabdus sp.]|jgi:dehydrogenase/reductase SDR family protein 7B|uniref:SDR family NAD(P)-dependent oxidoreductase n=1 Tax=Sphingorhabdus sp. TaxID=1902408 RepID=UPI003BAE454D|nr:SDR family NAD(P)-dependent oxidoreductase [Sphingomonadales bacterium]MBK9433460.1 SDR family NAD(P)-dependent oxidoreductase [Sphingomonadales bacterium]MBL0020905.1 SDR family NAD(P)-dependent oxidoreductase [Sphingomonadales bacterium]
MSDHQGQTAWITGASSGIGAALVKAWLADGGNCILSGRNVEALNAVAAEAGAMDRVLILPFEATDFPVLGSVVEQATGWKGQVDVLVNNAGVSQRSLAIDTQLSVYEDVIGIDLMAPIALTQALLPHMTQRGSGKLVMISSVAGKVGVPMRTAYCAAKFGLIGYADSLRAEVAGMGLSVLVVAPGSVRTNVSRNALTADGSVRGVSDPAIENGIDPDQVARQIWEALDAGQREIAIAEGIEAQMVAMKSAEPEKLFDMIEAMIAAGYAKKMDATKEA